MDRYMRHKQTGHPEDCPQVSWSTAEVVYDKHGEAVVRQGLVDYHQSGDHNGE